MNTVNGVMLTCLQMHRAILSMVQVKNGGNRIRLLIIDSTSYFITPILGGKNSQGMHLLYLAWLPPKWIRSIFMMQIYILYMEIRTLHQCQCVIFLIKTCVLPQTQSS